MPFATLSGPSLRQVFATAMCLLSSVATEAQLLERTQSSFNGEILVLEQGGKRNLVTRSRGQVIVQSRISIESPSKLIDSYTQMMSLASNLHSNPERVFNIGLGGGVLPRFHLSRHPTSSILSVEIDPEIARLAERYFAVSNPRHQIIIGDGAELLRTAALPFDLIWVDAYSGIDGIPKVFKKSEFVRLAASRLRPAGIVVANLWEESPLLFDDLANRYREPFTNGIRIRVPGAANQIVAVGNNPNLNCQMLRNLYEEWREQGLITLAWELDGRDQNTTLLCRDF